MKIKKLFHYISYLQYPLMLMGVFFVFKPYFIGLDELDPEKVDLVINSLTNVLIFLGLGISFSSLQDTTKTQNKFSRKIWENPKKGKIAVAIMLLTTIITLTIGLLMYFLILNNKFKELAVGVMILGVGLIGWLKLAIELFENHRIIQQN